MIEWTLGKMATAPANDCDLLAHEIDANFDWGMCGTGVPVDFDQLSFTFGLI